MLVDGSSPGNEDPPADGFCQHVLLRGAVACRVGRTQDLNLLGQGSLSATSILFSGVFREFSPQRSAMDPTKEQLGGSSSCQVTTSWHAPLLPPPARSSEVSDFTRRRLWTAHIPKGRSLMRSPCQILSASRRLCGYGRFEHQGGSDCGLPDKVKISVGQYRGVLE